MDKKRRVFANCEVLPKTLGSDDAICHYLMEQKDFNRHDGLEVTTYFLKTKFGEGTVVHIQFDGISIDIIRCKFHRDIVFFPRLKDVYLQLSFLLKGQKIISADALETDVIEESHDSYMACVASFEGSVRISGGKKYKEIDIRLSRSFLDDHGCFSDHRLKTFTDKSLILPISERIYTTLRAIEKTKLNGTTGSIYLKAKMLELLALQLNNYSDTGRIGSAIKLGGDIKKIYAVKQLLADNLNRNYSIKELCKINGLNENKLKTEFKRVFGISVNSYHQSEKMKKAKALLDSTELLVYQVAEEIGYKNATHFSAAFKRQFQITPKQYRDTL